MEHVETGFDFCMGNPKNKIKSIFCTIYVYIGLPLKAYSYKISF